VIRQGAARPYAEFGNFYAGIQAKEKLQRKTSDTCLSLQLF
jgi:hypothetical protein